MDDFSWLEDVVDIDVWDLDDLGVLELLGIINL